MDIIDFNTAQLSIDIATEDNIMKVTHDICVRLGIQGEVTGRTYNGWPEVIFKGETGKIQRLQDDYEDGRDLVTGE